MEQTRKDVDPLIEGEKNTPATAILPSTLNAQDEKKPVVQEAPEVKEKFVPHRPEHEQFQRELAEARALDEQKQVIARQINDAAPLLNRLNKDRGRLYFFNNEGDLHASQNKTIACLTGLFASINAIVFADSTIMKIAGAAMGAFCTYLLTYHQKNNYGASSEHFHEFDFNELRKINDDLQAPSANFSFR